PDSVPNWILPSPLPSASSTMKPIAIALLTVLAACAPSNRTDAPSPAADAAARTHPFDALEARIRERIARESGVEVGVSVVDLATGMRLGVNERLEMHAASTMK